MVGVLRLSRKEGGREGEREGRVGSSFDFDEGGWFGSRRKGRGRKEVSKCACGDEREGIEEQRRELLYQ